MRSHRELCSGESGLTWVEVIVALIIVGALAALALPRITTAFEHPASPQTLSNMRQLYLATQVMAQDGTSTGETNLNWPGNTGGSYSNWMIGLVPAYLSTNDFCKLMSAPQVSVPNSHLPAMRDTALLVYAVRSEGDTNAVFLTTANFTNSPAGGASLNPQAKPYGNKLFVVFRRGGEGAILLKNQATNTNLIGGFAPLCQ